MQFAYENDRLACVDTDPPIQSSISLPDNFSWFYLFRFFNYDLPHRRRYSRIYH
jgi:hypothetical protein